MFRRKSVLEEVENKDPFSSSLQQPSPSRSDRPQSSAPTRPVEPPQVSIPQEIKPVAPTRPTYNPAPKYNPSVPNAAAAARQQRDGAQEEDRQQQRPASSTNEGKRLVVGPDISLSGEVEVKDCDVVIVEGTIGARLIDSKRLEITKAGLFKGSADIDDAIIAGRFEGGELKVKKRLIVKATGQVIAKVFYNELQIEPGGEISGEIQKIS